MAESAEVVVIGEGAIGASVPYHVAGSGCAKVIIVACEPKQGMGSTYALTCKRFFESGDRRGPGLGYTSHLSKMRFVS